MVTNHLLTGMILQVHPGKLTAGTQKWGSFGCSDDFPDFKLGDL